MNPKYQPKQMEVEPSKPVIRNAKGEIVPEEKLRKLEHTLATQPKQPGQYLKYVFWASSHNSAIMDPLQDVLIV